jgi:hypothetical protein
MLKLSKPNHTLRERGEEDEEKMKEILFRADSFGE